MDTYFGPWLGYKILEYLGLGEEKVVSPYRPTYEWWPERTTEAADCRTNDSGSGWDHPAPEKNCYCGFYAYFGFRDAQENQQLFNTAMPLDVEFVCLVAGWGDVVIHKTGFRSEFMEVLAVHRGPYKHADKLERFAESYGVPYLTRNQMEDYAHECGVLLTPETMP